MAFSYLHFFYAANNKPAMVEYNGTPYTYVKNLQGDIVAILDSAGNIVVQYKYDAWGRIISKTGSLASTLGTVQPFRYRGYVYDEETGLYYLRDRYYYPNLGRFINADVPQVAELKYYHHNQYNQYLYCNNQPITDRDDEGTLSLFGKIALGIGLAVCAAAVTVLTCGVGTATVVGAVAVGAAKGALVGAAVGTVAGAGIGYATTGTLDGAIEGAACGFGVGAVTGAIIGGTVCSGGSTTSQLTQAANDFYYQVTSRDAAANIMREGVLRPSSVEGSVCILNFQPTLAQAKQLGAMAYETVIRFSVNPTMFTRDVTIPFAGALRCMRDGPIVIKNIVEVGFK